MSTSAEAQTDTNHLDLKRRPHIKPRERECSGDCQGYLDDFLNDIMLIPRSNSQVTLDKTKSSQEKNIHVLYVDTRAEKLKTFAQVKEGTAIFHELNVPCQNGSILFMWFHPIYRLLLRMLLKLCSHMHDSGLTFSSFDLKDIYFDGKMWKISSPCLVILLVDNEQRKARINETFCSISHILKEAFGIDDKMDAVCYAGLKHFFHQLAKHEGDCIYDEYMMCHYAVLDDTERVDFIRDIFLYQDQVPVDDNGNEWKRCLKKVQIGVWLGFLESKSYLLLPFQHMVDEKLKSNQYSGDDKTMIAKKLAKGTYNFLRLCKNAVNHLVLNDYRSSPTFKNEEVLHMIEIQFLKYLIEIQWIFYQSKILHIVWMKFKKRAGKLFKHTT